MRAIAANRPGPNMPGGHFGFADPDPQPEEQVFLPIWDVGPQAERFVEKLRELFKSLGREGSAQTSPSRVHGYYGPMPGESVRDVLLKVLLAPHDQRVPASIRMKIRRFLSAHLPNLFFKRSPRLPGPVPALSLQEKARVRAAYKMLLELYREKPASPEAIVERIKQFFPQRQMNGFFLAKIQRLSRETQLPAYDRARDTLAALFSRSRDTVDKLLRPGNATPRGR
jgi:hypothetical protein